MKSLRSARAALVFIGMLPGLFALAQTIPINEVHEKLPQKQQDSVMAVLQRYYSDDYYVTPQIPNGKVDSASGYFRLYLDEQVLGLLDCTAKSCMKYGIIFGTSGIYVNNDEYSDHPGRYFIPYSSLKNMPVTSGGFLEVRIGTTSVNVSGAGMRKKTVIQLLNEIKSKI
ncbi:MAG TPA: hypothetical protein VI112_02745 [Bacteroidia bacterium]|jgi:hypothetical protein